MKLLGVIGKRGPDGTPLTALDGPRVRAHWINLHELVRLDTMRASTCKHCGKTFTDEEESSGRIPPCGY